MDVVKRTLRSLHMQLFLWAVTPVTFVLIALSFTGVYMHQQTMRDFVVERDVAMAHLLAGIAEDGLAHGVVGGDGHGIAAWMTLDERELPDTTMIVNGEGQVLAHSVAGRAGADVRHLPGIEEALIRLDGFVIVPGEQGPLLVTFAPIRGTDWIVVIQEPVQELIGPILRFPSLIPAIAVGAGLLSLFVLTFGWLTIVRPLQQLARSAEQVSWGEYDALDAEALAQPVRGVQEVQDLRQSLADMVERIRGYEAGVRDYMGALTRGQEAERARLARELHDGPVQGLIALAQRAEMAQRQVERDRKEEAQALLAQVRRTGQQTAQELRRTIGALRPVYLEDLGFVPALEMLVRQTAERTDAEVRLEQERTVQRLASEVELGAYRIAQEALNNAVQHAQAEHIVVRMGFDAQTLTLAVRDDGAGFCFPDKPDLLTRDGHFGLIGMQERAVQLGGTLDVDSAPGAGTRVVARLPARPYGQADSTPSSGDPPPTP
jgi:signal transduction histidine kinase